MKKVIIISAHPDDETLGAGGTLLKHKQQGDELYWIIATSIFEKNGYSAERIQERSDEISKVATEYGFIKVYQLGFPTMTLSSENLPVLVMRISEVFQEEEPEVIYTINRSDAHSDHRLLFDAVMACTKSFRYPYIRMVMMYECVSETEFGAPLAENVFLPNYFVDITPFFKKKMEIMKIFESELGNHPFPRSMRNIEALAVYRGATAGVEYAEAFQLLKMIDK